MCINIVKVPLLNKITHNFPQIVWPWNALYHVTPIDIKLYKACKAHLAQWHIVNTTYMFAFITVLVLFYHILYFF